MLLELGKAAEKAAGELRKLNLEKRNSGLTNVAKALVSRAELILEANRKDVERAEADGMKESLLDRLVLTKKRIEVMAEGLLDLAQLADPLGGMVSMTERPNGLQIGRKRVPLGVIGIIYESRPNVTTDAFGLCFKTGNAVILKGGSEALESNKAIVAAIQSGLVESGVSPESVQLITDTSRAVTAQLMKMNQYLDVLIPRGGAGLIKAVVENSTIPVIETGTGNCHIFVDRTADIQMALDIIVNAKTQRIGVCNACESLLIHKEIAAEFLPLLAVQLQEKQVEVRGDQMSREIVPSWKEATMEDWGTEYLDLIVSVKIVDQVEQAIQHINKYNTKHSEAIVTSDYFNAQKFLNEVDAAAVYVNASTRFTDGFEFGFGAEIGVSTQKLHARGPMGLEALTTTKYIVYGTGQIRT